MNQKKEPHPDPCNYVNFKRAEGTIPCPDCQQPPASEFTKKIRAFIKLYENELPKRAEITFLEEACAIINRAEASKKDLLTALKIGLRIAEYFSERAPASKDLAEDTETIRAAIANS